MNGAPLTPVELETLLHIYYTATLPSNSQACRNAAQKLHNLRAIINVPESSDRTCTDLGRAWVKAICATPIPTQAFLDASGKVIDM